MITPRRRRATTFPKLNALSQVSGMPVRSFQFGRTSTRFPLHFMRRASAGIRKQDNNGQITVNGAVPPAVAVTARIQGRRIVPSDAPLGPANPDNFNKTHVFGKQGNCP